MSHTPQTSDRLAKLAGRIGAACLRVLPSESAHELGTKILNSKLFTSFPRPISQFNVNLQTSLPGVGGLAHPIGIAAGFDKNAICLRGLANVGFSFAEIGTITPKPQQGNPKPRLFRLPAQRAIVNRMGFNNDGIKAIHARLAESKSGLTIPVGINAGKNLFTQPDSAIDDYFSVIEAFKLLASYFVINISSPNTPGLRQLANRDFILSLAEIFGPQGLNCLSKIFIKLDPDLERSHFQSIVEIIADSGFAGLILTNTHIIEKPHKGGLSGHPLAIASTTRLEWAWHVHKGQLAMIGCGGILSGIDIFQKIIRGAACVQIYTAFIYRGPFVVYELLEELSQCMQQAGLSSIDEAVGSFYS